MTPSKPAAETRAAFPLTREAIAEKLKRPAPRPAPEDRHLVTLPRRRAYGRRSARTAGDRETACACFSPSARYTWMIMPGRLLSRRARRPADASREETALRETEKRSASRAAGSCRSESCPIMNASGFRITPWWAGSIRRSRSPDPFEVAGVFEAPLEHFIDERNYQRREYHFRGRHRHYLAIPFEGRYIWGATAGILFNLCRILRSEP